MVVVLAVVAPEHRVVRPLRRRAVAGGQPQEAARPAPVHRPVAHRERRVAEAVPRVAVAARGRVRAVDVGARDAPRRVIRDDPVVLAVEQARLHAAAGAGEHVEHLSARLVVVVHRPDRARAQVVGDVVGDRPVPEIGQLGPAAGTCQDVHPRDVPTDLRRAGRRSAGGVVDLARGASPQRERVADLRVARAVRRELAPVRARAVAVQRGADGDVGDADVADAVPVDAALVHAGGRRARAPVRPVVVVERLGVVVRVAPMHPQRVVRCLGAGDETERGGSGGEDGGEDAAHVRSLFKPCAATNSACLFTPGAACLDSIRPDSRRRQESGHPPVVTVIEMAPRRGARRPAPVERAQMTRSTSERPVL